jgi:hypothetical protein
MRKLILTAALAVMAFAAFAPAAFAETEVPAAQQAVSVTNEATGQACSAVTLTNDVASGTCPLHASSNGTVDAVSHTIFGETLRARCLNEYEGAVNASGEGRIGAAQISFADPGGGAGVDCTGGSAVRPCTEAEATNLGTDHQANWHLRTVEDGAGVLWIDARICLMNLDPFNSAVGGSVWLRVTSPSGHPTAAGASDHRLRDAETPLSADAEFDGSWSLETDATHSGVEISH